MVRRIVFAVIVGIVGFVTIVGITYLCLPGYEGIPKYVDFGFAEGCEPITVFWIEDGHYYGQQTSKLNKLS